jgi:CIC family chloride channel protein
VARLFEPYSVYTKVLASQGVWSQHQHDRTVLAKMDLDAVLETDFVPVGPRTTLGELAEVIAQSKRNIFPVVAPSGKLLGVIHLDAIRPYMFRTEMYQVLVADDIMLRPPAVIDRDMEMLQVAHLFERHRVWNLPVTEKGRYIGFVSQSRIFNEYRRTLMRQDPDIVPGPDETGDAAAAGETGDASEPPQNA